MTSDTNSETRRGLGEPVEPPAAAWLIRLSLAVHAGELGRLHATLSADERERAARGRPDVQRRFVACRGRLRLLLARLLNVEPRDVVFRYGRQGKPSLEGEGSHGWRFNISHSGDVAIFAISRSEVGVDIEVTNGRESLESLAASAPSILADGERLAWLALPGCERIGALLRTWVAKEALLKAMGHGIGAGMDRFSLPMPVGPAPRLAIGTTHILPLHQPRPCSDGHFGGNVPGVSLFTAEPGEYAAVACVGAACSVRFAPFEQVMTGQDLHP